MRALVALFAAVILLAMIAFLIYPRHRTAGTFLYALAAFLTIFVSLAIIGVI